MSKFAGTIGSVSKFAEAMRGALKEQYASLTAEEKSAQAAKLTAARIVAYAKKRAAGEWTDQLGPPEKRRALGRVGGLASAAARTGRMGPAERAQLEAARAIFSLKRRALRPPDNQQVIPPAEAKLLRDRLVQVPRSSGGRGQQLANGAFFKLLSNVQPNRHDGFGFEGVPLRPGGTVRECDLWPSKNFPPQPVGLECAGRVRESGESVFVLWRLESRKWVELARAQSRSSEWASSLRPLAVRALAQQGFPKPKKSVDLIARTSRIATLLDAQLVGLDADDKNCIICFLHDHFMAQLSAGSAETIPAIAEVIVEKEPSIIGLAANLAAEEKA